MADEPAPATKKDVADVRLEVAEVRREVASGRQEVAGTRAGIELRLDRLLQHMRAMQTELLKASGPWHENIQVRDRQLEMSASNSDIAIKTRMDTLARRLVEIERKLLLNPPAA